jgi:hypothetical protein
MWENKNTNKKAFWSKVMGESSSGKRAGSTVLVVLDPNLSALPILLMTLFGGGRRQRKWSNSPVAQVGGRDFFYQIPEAYA